MKQERQMPRRAARLPGAVDAGAAEEVVVGRLAQRTLAEEPELARVKVEAEDAAEEQQGLRRGL